jgi:hypothetical protein
VRGGGRGGALTCGPTDWERVWSFHMRSLSAHLRIQMRRTQTFDSCVVCRILCVRGGRGMLEGRGGMSGEGDGEGG